MVLGRHLEYGEPSSLELWLASADNIDDPAVFLVRASLGGPAFARVCTEADMVNYPTSATDAPGWYRALGVVFELYSSETMGHIIEDCETGLSALDAELSTGSAEASETVTMPLHLYRIGDTIGNLIAVKTDRGDSFSYDFTVQFTDTDIQALVDTAVFKVSTGDFAELLAVRTPGDVEDSTSATESTFSSSVTVYLNKDKPELEAGLYGALVADIEDLCSFSYGAS